MLKNIVVGISSAETSHIAARQAFELAEPFGATVHLVTAVEKDELSVIELGSDRFEISDIDAATEAARSFANRVKPKVPWKAVAAEGRPAGVLLAVAEQVDAELIVVGNVRMQGIGRVLGSVGNEVVHHAPCNVLIVKTV